MWEQIVLVMILILLAFILIKLYLNPNKNIEHALNKETYLIKEELNKEFNHFTDRMDRRLSELQERNSYLETQRNINSIKFQESMDHKLDLYFGKQEEQLERRLMLIDRKVNESLSEGFDKTNETFTNIVSRLSKIDEAQKKIDNLSVEVVSLQDVLTDKKTRGVYGEVQLNQVLSSVFGDKNDLVYQKQYQFINGTRADAVLFAPEPMGTVAIDSKFPLENYRIMSDKDKSETERNLAEKNFVKDCKKHIDDISSKYIIPNVTSDQAFMFIPAEAVFASINAYHYEIIDYAQKKNVWLVSPTTLMSTLTTVQAVLINMQRDRYAAQIHEHLNLLSVEFARYKQRWDKLSRNIDTVSNNVKDIHITTDKISKKFDDISTADNEIVNKG